MKTLVSWSTGKDSAWALHRLRQTPGIEIAGLFTTVNAAHGRVAMHAVRRELLQAQAAAAQLPLHEIEIPDPCSDEVYEATMGSFVAGMKEAGVTAMAFGDLFLADVRAYRERMLSGSGVTPIFPIWGADTRVLASHMIDAGVVAHLTCIDPARLPRHCAGSVFDRKFLAALPADVDPCGENGEFHTFVSAGPMFAAPVPVQSGAVVERGGFLFADLLMP